MTTGILELIKPPFDAFPHAVQQPLKGFGLLLSLVRTLRRPESFPRDLFLFLLPRLNVKAFIGKNIETQ
jgi:hypothetical protein